jgi:hypothetical protein
MAIRTPERLKIGEEEYLRRRAFATESAARKWRDRMRALDFLAEMRPFSDEGETFYAVYVRNPKGLSWKLVNTYNDDYE